MHTTEQRKEFGVPEALSGRWGQQALLQPSKHEALSAYEAMFRCSRRRMQEFRLRFHEDAIAQNHHALAIFAETVRLSHTSEEVGACLNAAANWYEAWLVQDNRGDELFSDEYREALEGLRSLI